ncbi:MAG TPA: 16S rRNA (uracil(1498)-N(3))-methyltransferase [Phycisphaerae bacterium]|nr:16S rRNA (uracil(1498)-N(3))-methyltransferase [Phycisphaerae bacterium]
MTVPRFYVPEISASEQPLPEDQSHHALHVLRMQNGDDLVVFDGAGKWAEAKLLLRHKEAYCRIEGPIQQDPLPSPRITLACAIPKADRAQTLVEQISQIGATRLIWLDCRFSVVRPGAEGGKMNKWRRLAVESAKQCGRSWLLDIQPPQNLPPVLEMALMEKAKIFWADPQADQLLLSAAQEHKSSNVQSIFILIGPEGGWSEEESQSLSALSKDGRVIPVKLGDNILRIETAALAATAIVAQVFNHKKIHR